MYTLKLQRFKSLLSIYELIPNTLSNRVVDPLLVYHGQRCSIRKAIYQCTTRSMCLNVKEEYTTLS